MSLLYNKSKMDLRVNFNTCQRPDLTSLDFYEMTQIYNSGNNIYGYGTPNPMPSDITLATLEVTLPNTSVPIVLTLKGGLLVTSIPNVDNTVGFNITSLLLGLAANSKLPDGVYHFKYTVSGTFLSIPFTSYTECDRFFTGQAELCLDKKVANIEPIGECEDCENDNLEDTFKTFCMIMASTFAANVEKKNKANKIISYVNSKCSTPSCNNC